MIAIGSKIIVQRHLALISSGLSSKRGIGIIYHGQIRNGSTDREIGRQADRPPLLGRFVSRCVNLAEVVQGVATEEEVRGRALMRGQVAE